MHKDQMKTINMSKQIQIHSTNARNRGIGKAIILVSVEVIILQFIHDAVVLYFFLSPLFLRSCET